MLLFHIVKTNASGKRHKWKPSTKFSHEMSGTNYGLRHEDFFNCENLNIQFS